MPQAISADAKIGPSWSEGEDRERAGRFCADGNKTGKLLGGRSCGRKARNFCYWAPEDRGWVGGWAPLQTRVTGPNWNEN